MANLKHLMLCARAGETDQYWKVNMSSMLGSLQHLTELETLDLKLVSIKRQLEWRVRPLASMPLEMIAVLISAW